MMFFDRAMLAMGNVSSSIQGGTSLIHANARAIQILFLIGLTIIIGIQKTVVFFARRQKLKGTAAFAAGITLILFKWPFIGFIVELYGLFVLFGDFLSTIGGFAGNIPVVGPYIAAFLQRISGGPRNKELPV